MDVMISIQLVARGLCAATFFLLCGSFPHSAQAESEDMGFSSGAILLGEFEEDWRKQWKGKRLHRNKTAYEVVQDGDELVLQAESVKSASLLWRKLSVEEPEVAILSWRWKVSRSLVENDRELEKKGDDYAARVFVVFDPGLFGKNIRSICYVWAGNQPVEATYPNPYSKTVITVVLETGDEHAGEWIEEKRDVVADFRRLFEEDPPAGTGVAVMSDTDNTWKSATAWFDDLRLTVGEQPGS